MSIRIVTEDGQWERYVTRDDSLFADIIAPVLELGDDGVVLRSAVAEIVKSEWDAAWKLIQWKKKYDSYNAPYTCLTMDMARLFYPYVRKFPQPILPRPDVLLDEVLHISRILTLPEGWESCVAISPTMPITEDVIRHMEVVGRSVADNDKYRLYDAVPDRPGLRRARAMYVMEILYRLINGSRKSPATKAEEVKIATIAIMQDALLRCRSDELLMEDVNWSLLLTLFKKFEVPEESLAYNTVATFLGKGNAELTSMKSRIRLHTPMEVLLEVPISSHQDEIITYLYDNALQCFPDDVEPVLFGLNAIRDVEVLLKFPDEERMRNKMMRIVPFVNHHVLLRYAMYKEGIKDKYKIRSEDFPIIIRLLDRSVIGRRGLIRILLSLLHLQEVSENVRRRLELVDEYASYYRHQPRPQVGLTYYSEASLFLLGMYVVDDSNKNDRERITTFIELIEEYVGNVPERPRGKYAMPTIADIMEIEYEYTLGE